MPRDRDAVLDLVLVLGINARAIFERTRDPLRRRQRRELVGVDAEYLIGAKQHGFAGSTIARARIGDHADRLVGIADAAVNPVVLLPEAAFELQTDFDGWRVRNRVDGILQWGAHRHLDLTEDR